MQESSEADMRRDSLDAIAEDLQQLRVQAGEVSYAEIVRRIGKRREAEGMDPSISRPARTTVYDVFRTGRTRINVSLVGEIVKALGCTETQSAAWEARCLAVRSEASRRNEPVAVPAEPEILVPSDVPEQVELPQALADPKKPRYILLLACLAMNLLGYWLISATGFPLYLDMIGTAVAAIVCGPWVGAVVGLSTNLLGLGITGESSAAFGLVNVAGALVWGYGARAIRPGHVISKFALLNAAVAFVCSVVASILLVLIFNGETGHGSEATMNTLLAKTGSLALAVFNSNIVYSLVDKLLTGFIALALISRFNDRLGVKSVQEVDGELRNLLQRKSMPPTFNTKGMALN